MNVKFAVAAVGLLWAARAAAEGEIYATNLDGLIQADQQGLYDKVLKLLDFEYQALPAARAENYMVRDSACLFPVDRRFLEISAELIQSDPIDVINIKIYSVDGGLETIDDLKGKTVGLRLGLNYGPKINAMQKLIKTELATSLEQNLKKLKSKRVDAVLEFQLDVEQFVKANPDFVFKASAAPVDVHNDSVTCYDNPVNRRLIDSYNEALRAHRAEVDRLIRP